MALAYTVTVALAVTCVAFFPFASCISPSTNPFTNIQNQDLSTEIPEEWAARVKAGQMLWVPAKSSGSADADADTYTRPNVYDRPGFNPPLGNGFLAGDGGVRVDGTGLCRLPHDSDKDRYSYYSGCGRLHVAGVFNNRGGSNIPQRADIPNQHSVYVDSVSSERVSNASAAATAIGSVLDLQYGVFRNRSRVDVIRSDEEGTARGLQVLTIDMEMGRDQEDKDQKCTFQLEAVKLENITADFDVTSETQHHFNDHDQHVKYSPNRLPQEEKSILQDQAVQHTFPFPFAFTSQTLTVRWMEDPPANATHDGYPTPNKTVVGAAFERVVPEKTWATDEDGASTGTGSSAGNHARVITLTAAAPHVRFLSAYSTSLETGQSGVTPSTAEATAVARLRRYKAMSTEELWAAHVRAWDEVWVGGIEIEGNLTVAQTVNSSLFYILSAIREDMPTGVSPGGLARNDYNGHSFWDCETWMFPNCVFLYPALAESLANYRFQRLPAAYERARLHGYHGAFWPWESALVGFGVSEWHIGDVCEIHIGGDIVHALRLSYYGSRNDTWLRDVAWPMINATAAFYAGRLQKEGRRMHLESYNYTIKQVIGPDEQAGVVDDNAYTNAIAGQTLDFAIEAAAQLGLNHTIPSAWHEMARSIYLPLVTNLNGTGGKPIHPEFTAYKGQAINQADVALLQYPLGVPMPDDLAARDLLYYQARSSGPTTAGFYTGDSAYSIAWLKLNNRTAADQQFNLAFEHMDIGGYNVWMEKSHVSHDFPGNVNFLTGAGGYLQNYIFGYGGLRIENDRMTFANPVLPPYNVTAVTFRGFAFASRRLTLRYDQDTLSLTMLSGGGSTGKGGGKLDVVDAKGSTHSLDAQTPLTLPRQPISIQVPV